MGANEGKSGAKRANLPVAELSLQLLQERCGHLFGRGFRLRLIGTKLYVQLSGLKVPLHLDYETDPLTLQERALALRRYLASCSGSYSAPSWRALCLGAPSSQRLRPVDRRTVISNWRRLKLAEGVSESTFQRHYLSHMMRLNELDPLSDQSLLGAIEQVAPGTATRKRVVAFLRQLAQAHDAKWNAALLDPLQQRGRATVRRGQPCFSDEAIERLLEHPELPPHWRKVLALLAIYGLRPWEAWTAEPCWRHRHCIWVPQGKVNRFGATIPRSVPPFHPEWRQRYAPLLEAELPRLASLSRAGASVNQVLRRHGLDEATSYGFRHAYARRLHSPRYRVTDTHGALFMGHTVQAHNRAYRNWLGEDSPIEMYMNGHE